ncbi:hypothetical protein TNCV_3762081 [Trichonephila clavipes]|nr:hypothetical protein TNCV_3762081 [Trichonephila clavipes]
MASRYIFFVDKTATGHVYLDMLENFAVLQVPPGFLFQKDGAVPHYHGDVTAFLNRTFQESWIGRGEYLGMARRPPIFDPILQPLQKTFECPHAAQAPSEGILTSHYSATRGPLVMGLVILNFGQVMRTIPKLAPPLLTSPPHQ